MSWDDMDMDEQGDHLLELLQAGRGNRPVGQIYYVACPATMRIKIGFTAGKVEQRVKALQTGSASELRLIAVRPGTLDDESALHAYFADHRVHGEWFEMCEYIFEHLLSIVWCAGYVHLRNDLEFPDWLRAGLRMLEDYFGELPRELGERL